MKMNRFRYAVYDQVIEEFISGDTSCFFQTLCQIEDLNNPSIKEFMQGYLKENEDDSNRLIYKVVVAEGVSEKQETHV
jgi:hypothetical protein